MADEAQGRGQLWAGILLIVFGALFLIDQFDVLAFSRFFSDWWPSLLILLGAYKLIVGPRRSWTGPLVLIALGVIFQLQELHVFWWARLHRLWPLILIAVGIGILINRMQRSEAPEHPADNQAKT